MSTFLGNGWPFFNVFLPRSKISSKKSSSSLSSDSKREGKNPLDFDVEAPADNTTIPSSSSPSPSANPSSLPSGTVVLLVSAALTYSSSGVRLFSVTRDSKLSSEEFPSCVEHVFGVSFPPIIVND